MSSLDLDTDLSRYIETRGEEVQRHVLERAVEALTDEDRALYCALSLAGWQFTFAPFSQVYWFGHPTIKVAGGPHRGTLRLAILAAQYEAMTA